MSIIALTHNLTLFGTVEARGIKGVEKNGNSDPMVELWVNNDKKHCVKTKAFENTLTPQVR